jgi:hypothetical protein
MVKRQQGKNTGSTQALSDLGESQWGCSCSREGYSFDSFRVCTLYSRGSRFWSFNFLHFAIDGKNNSKTKVEKVFFFIFMSSYAEMSF